MTPFPFFHDLGGYDAVPAAGRELIYSIDPKVLSICSNSLFRLLHLQRAALHFSETIVHADEP